MRSMRAILPRRSARSQETVRLWPCTASLTCLQGRHGRRLKGHAAGRSGGAHELGQLIVAPCAVEVGRLLWRRAIVGGVDRVGERSLRRLEPCDKHRTAARMPFGPGRPQHTRLGRVDLRSPIDGAFFLPTVIEATVFRAGIAACGCLVCSAGECCREQDLPDKDGGPKAAQSRSVPLLPLAAWAKPAHGRSNTVAMTWHGQVSQGTRTPHLCWLADIRWGFRCDRQKGTV